MRVLRSLNSRKGAELLTSSFFRKYLIDGDLTVGETGRVYKAKKLDLLMVCSRSAFK